MNLKGLSVSRRFTPLATVISSLTTGEAVVVLEVAGASSSIRQTLKQSLLACGTVRCKSRLLMARDARVGFTQSLVGDLCGSPWLQARKADGQKQSEEEITSPEKRSVDDGENASVRSL